MIDWELKAYIDQQIRQAAARWTTMHAPSADGGDEADPPQQRTGAQKETLLAQRYQHYGFRSSPPAGAKLLTVPVGASECQRASIASEMPGAGPTDQESGEAEIYTVFGSSIELDKNGQVTILTSAGAQVQIDNAGNITITAAAGKDVVVNGASAAVARVADPVSTGALTITATQNAMPTSVDLSFSYTDSEAVPSTTGPVNIHIPNATTSTPGTFVMDYLGVITAGAPHFKGQ
jgi:phage gp45-like